ncbi:MAG: uncharacterized protein K0R98_910 [Rickettsiaceae bacterium]|jgi:hypothetical protein|nr:uncharacterized protein [Rickettsiaceae bacterium]
MQYKTTRKIALKIHIIVAVYQLLYIYSPLHEWQYAFTVVQFVAFPLLAITGFWLARGKKIWKNFHKSDASIAPVKNNIQILAPRSKPASQICTGCDAYKQAYTMQ